MAQVPGSCPTEVSLGTPAGAIGTLGLVHGEIGTSDELVGRNPSVRRAISGDAIEALLRGGVQQAEPSQRGKTCSFVVGYLGWTHPQPHGSSRFKRRFRHALDELERRPRDERRVRSPTI